MRNPVRRLLFPFTVIAAVLLAPATAHADWDIQLTNAATGSDIQLTTGGGRSTFQATGPNANISVTDIANRFAAGDRVRIVAQDTGGLESGMISYIDYAADPTGRGIELVPGAGSWVDSAQPLSFGSIRIEGEARITDDITTTVGDVVVTGPLRSGSIDAAGAIDLQSTFDGIGLMPSNLTSGTTIHVGDDIGTATAPSGMTIDSGTSFSFDGTLIRVGTNPLTIVDPITMTRDLTLDPGPTGSVDVASIDGPHDLAIGASGATVTFGNIGVTTRPTSVSVNGSDITPTATSIRASGPIDMSLGGSATLTIAYNVTIDAGAGSVTLPLLRDIGMPRALTVNSTGVTRFDKVDAPTLSITTNAGGTTAITIPPFATFLTGDLHVNDPATASAATGAKFAGTTVDFAAGLDTQGTHLLLNTSDARLGGTIATGGDVTTYGDMQLSSASITGTSIDVPGAVTLQGANTVSNVMTAIFHDTIDGPGSLTITTPGGVGSARFVDKIGATTPVGGFDVRGGIARFGDIVPFTLDASGAVYVAHAQLDGSSTVISSDTSVQLEGIDAAPGPLTVDSPAKGIGGAMDATGAIRLTGGLTEWTVTSQAHTPTVTVDADLLAPLPSSPAVSAFELRNGGTLAGTGTFLSATATGPGRGVLAPGTTDTPVGDLSVTDIAGGSLATLRVDSEAVATDVVHNSGGTALGGATLEITTGATAPVGVARTILDITAPHAFPGTFAGVPEGALVTAGDGSIHQVSYTGGTGDDVTITRRQFSSTTAIAQSSATSQTGTALDLTATVTSTQGSPTGTVTFRSGSQVLGTASVVAGVATLRTTTLAAGTYDIVAAYGGSPGYTASTSGSVQHVRSAPPTTTDPTTTTPPMRSPQLRLTDTCTTVADGLPTARVRVSRAARVTYTLSRRDTPLPARAAWSCRGASAGEGSGGAGSGGTFSTIRARTKLQKTAGRYATDLQELFADAPLFPGVYRVTVRLVGVAGGAPVTQSLLLTVAQR